MARINLSIPDDLRARMDTVDQFVNWSTVAQKAFERQVEVLTPIGTNSMSNVLERLRASKEKQVDNVVSRGFVCGKTWAEDGADYLSLKSVAEYDWNSVDVGALRSILHQILRIQYTYDKFWVLLFSEEDADETISDAPNEFFVKGFIDGARAVWQEVRDKL